MEHLVLGLVWLLGMLDSVSPKCGRELDIVVLDMAPNSYDDQYEGCSQLMEKELKELNYTEFVAKTNYSKAWKAAAAEWQKRSPRSSVLKPEQEIALMAYTLETPRLYKDFNAAVRKAGRSRGEYLHNFPYKAMHFLMTSALRSLRDAQPQCYDVYRGVKNIFTAQPGETVRFGQFASTSLRYTCAKNFGTNTFFTVKTCYGVPIKKLSFFPEEEVLIPPFEIFKVTNVTHKGNSALIQLQSQGVYSKYNCEYVKGQSVIWAPLWGFLLAATALATTVGI